MRGLSMKRRGITGSRVRFLVAAALASLLLVPAAEAQGPAITQYNVQINPTSIVAGPGGNLWFVDDNVNGYGEVTPAGVVSLWNWDNVASDDVGFQQIAAGLDGNLWLTMCGGLLGPAIQKITPAGAATYYPVSSCPDGITAGPDGNMWFTETYGAIGKITMGGQVTEYDGSGSGLLPADSHPIGIVAGPDGALWFTEWGDNRIGRITTGGVLTNQYQLAANTGPAHIVAGPDGNLWFTEDTADRIGKLTTSGTLTEYSAGITPGSYPEGIAVGPDDNLWFTEYMGGQIGEITPSGVITQSGSSIYAPAGIAAGPDGDIWFTEFDGGKIGRLDLHPHTLAVTRTGNGAGTVTSSPAGLSCGATCSYAFPFDETTITLTAAPSAASVFSGWSGPCTGTAACTMQMSADSSVNAIFKKACIVPKVGGEKLKRAEAAIRTAHCSVGKVKKAFSHKVKKGLVTSQTPHSGSKRPPGTKVSLKLSQGKPARSRY